MTLTTTRLNWVVVLVVSVSETCSAMLILKPSRRRASMQVATRRMPGRSVWCFEAAFRWHPFAFRPARFCYTILSAALAGLTISEVFKLLFSFENCSLDTDRRELRHEGELRSVEPQVFDLLEFLI